MKLNLGCGHNRREGYVNVDVQSACAPDVVHDLERFPWPWPDSSVEEVVLFHTLEHVGADPKVFLRIMQELYRVCAPGAMVSIAVPDPRHDTFLGDPTHVRPITPLVLQLFDRELNDRWQAQGSANTPLAHYLDVDFRMARTDVVLDPVYAEQLRTGEITRDDVSRLMRSHNNVAAEYRFELEVRK
jgi:hypothetical protein